MGRKEAREAIAGLFSSPGFTTINAFLPLSLNGTTKVLNVFSRGSSLDRISADLINNFHTFYLDTYILRAGTVADEDNLDALHQLIVAACIANPTNAAWSHLELDEETEVRPVQDAGTQYLRERHKVRVKITS